jgi:sister-chromatid-cohesion protein PDS5
MYLECLATQENVPFLYHLALKVKTVRDGESSEYDTVRLTSSTPSVYRPYSLSAKQNLYMLSELAQHLIKLVAKAHGWAIPTHPKSTSMPSDIFRTLPDKVTAKRVRPLSTLVIVVSRPFSDPRLSFR